MLDTHARGATIREHGALHSFLRGNTSLSYASMGAIHSLLGRHGWSNTRIGFWSHPDHGEVAFRKAASLLADELPP